MGLTLRLTGCGVWLHPLFIGCCAWGLPQGTGFALLDYGACQDHPFGLPLVELIGWCSVVVWSWPPGPSSGPVRLSFFAGQGQLLPMTCLGLSGRNYKMICDWSLTVLDLEVHGRGQAGKWDWPLLVLGLMQLKGPQGLPSPAIYP